MYFGILTVLLSNNRRHKTFRSQHKGYCPDRRLPAGQTRDVTKLAGMDIYNSGVPLHTFPQKRSQIEIEGVKSTPL